MNTNGLTMLAGNVNFLDISQSKPDQMTMDNVREGRAVKISLDKCKKDEIEFKNYFFRGVLGEIKYKVVTGKILDYKA